MFTFFGDDLSVCVLRLQVLLILTLPENKLLTSTTFWLFIFVKILHHRYFLVMLHHSMNFREPEAAVRRCFLKLVFLKLLQYSRENAFIKKTIQHRYFPVNIAKFLITAFCNRAPPVAASREPG